MEALFKEVVNGNMMVVAGLLAILYKMHREAMSKIDKLIEASNRHATIAELHAKELEHGDKRFIKVEMDIVQLRQSDHEIRNKIHDIRNKMVTHETLKEIVK